MDLGKHSRGTCQYPSSLGSTLSPLGFTPSLLGSTPSPLGFTPFAGLHPFAVGFAAFPTPSLRGVGWALIHCVILTFVRYVGMGLSSCRSLRQRGVVLAVGGACSVGWGWVHGWSVGWNERRDGENEPQFSLWFVFRYTLDGPIPSLLGLPFTIGFHPFVVGSYPPCFRPCTSSVSCHCSSSASCGSSSLQSSTYSCRNPAESSQFWEFCGMGF